MDDIEHIMTKVPVNIADISGIWSGQNDEVCLEMIKSIIWTANDPLTFWNKVCNEIDNVDFEGTLD